MQPKKNTKPTTEKEYSNAADFFIETAARLEKKQAAINEARATFPNSAKLNEKEAELRDESANALLEAIELRDSRKTWNFTSATRKADHEKKSAELNGAIEKFKTFGTTKPIANSNEIVTSLGDTEGLLNGKKQTAKAGAK
jgi:hypothetical protein